MSEIGGSVLQPGKILIIADGSSVWEIGGLKQLDRILLNVKEAFSGDSAPPLDVFVFWKGGEKRPWSFDHPRLKSLKPIISDDPASLETWLYAERKDVLLIRTNLLLGRGTLERTPHPCTVSLSEDELLQLKERSNDHLWEYFSGLLERVSGTQLSAEEGFYDVVKSSSHIDASERRLFRTLAKPTDGLVSTLLNRPLSTRLSRYLVDTPITPTIWTIILFFVALSGLWALTMGNLAGFIMGTFLFQVVSALDGCDGELARVRFQESRQGEWIDTISDLSGNIMFLFALGLGLSRQEGIDSFSSKLYFFEGVSTSLALIFTLWAVHRFTRKRESSGHFNNFGNSIIGEMKLPGWLESLSHFIAKILKRDTYTLIFFFMALFGQAPWILHIWVVGIIVHLAVLVSNSRSS